MPFYFWDYNRFAATSSLLLCCNTIIIIVCCIYPEGEQNSRDALFYVLILPVSYAGHVAMKNRKSFLKTCDIADVRSEYEIECTLNLLLFILCFSARTFSIRRCNIVYEAKK